MYLLGMAFFTHATELSISEAVVDAISNNHDIRLQRIAQQQAQNNIQVEASEFDPQFVAALNIQDNQIPLNQAEQAQLATLGIEHQRNEDITAYSLSASKKTSYGVTYRGAISSQHTSDSLNELQGGQSSADGVLSFSLTTPLNRSHSSDIVQAKLGAAEQIADASQLQMVSRINDLVADIASAYWSLVFARQQHAIALNSEKNMQGLLEDMRMLVEKDEIPRAELDLIDASHAEKKNTAQAAAMNVLSAQHQLSLLLASFNYKDLIPSHQVLPDGVSIALSALPHTEQAWQQAVDAHRDSRALKLSIGAQKMRKALARDESKSPLNLTLEASYRTLSEGKDAFQLSNIYGSNREGPSVLLNLEWLLPYKNRAAKAQSRDSDLSLDALMIQLQQHIFTLRQRWQFGYQTFLANQAQLKQQEIALKRYEQSLKNEHTKRRLGQSTWINVVNLTDRVDAARAQWLSLQLNTVLAALDYYKQRGVMVSSEDDHHFQIDFSKLLLNEDAS